MHLSTSSPHFLNVFTCKVVCFFTISVISLGITSGDHLTSPYSPTSTSHKARNQWSLKNSSPTRDGKFLNVPVYYGDWVPINSAKAQFESLFSSSVDVVPNDNRRRDEFVATASPILTTDDLTSPVKSSFVVSDHPSHNANQHKHHHPHSQVHEAEERVDIEHHGPVSFIGPRLPIQQTRDSAVRYNTVNRPSTRGRNRYRGVNAVEGNSRRKHRPTNSDALTRLFGPSFSWNGNRRQHRKIAQPQHSQNSLLGSIFGPAPSPTHDTSFPQTTTSTGSVALETLGTIGNHWPAFPNIRDSSESENPYVSQKASESIFQPIVKLLPSPNLTEDDKSTNHLIYEDDGNGRGDIIVGRRPGQNEIDGFIPVSSGQVIRPENHGHNRHHNHRHPSNFSVLISGINQNIDESSLARLFKEGKIAEDGEHSAFIGSPDAFAPDGFHKINLPFMNPSHTSSDPSQLPSIFIAPLGYKAPKGYKGHPLPFDPAPTNSFYGDGTKGKTVVHTTEPSSEFNDIVEQENEVKPKKFKNPFLRNKLRAQRLPYKPIKTAFTTEQSVLRDVSIKDSIATEKSDISSGHQNEASDSTNYVRSKIKFTRNRYKPQRKRVLTKIVRKPYNPSITTPSPTLETKKIVRIVDPTPISLKVEEYFPPTSGRPILGGRKAEDKIDLVVDQDYNVTKIKPSLGISTTFRPIQIKYIDLDLVPTRKSIAFNEPKATQNTPDTTSKESNFENDETDIKFVDHFEPTTTHNNLIFETTQYDDETTYKAISTDTEEYYEEKEETTLLPSSFVTRNTFAPAVTTYKPSTKIIQFLPYSPAATTRSTTTTTINRKKTTTSNAVTESNQSYEPTPFNFHLDPIARLEKLNRLKNKKYVGKNNWSSSIDKEEDNDYVVPTVRPTKSTQRNEKAPYKVNSSRIKYRKYGFNQGKDDGRIFGQRIKERKRPKSWDNGYVRDNSYATSTEAIETSTEKKSKTEEYKRKFRPFFDQLYERLTNDKDKDKENPSGNNRRISVFSVRRKIRPYNGWRKKSRSTTTPNPFTINAEIYEVHPESRARITTPDAPPPTFEVVTESSTFYQDYDDEVEEETPKSTAFGAKLDDSTNPLDQSELIDDQSAVHETADKHTPIHHDYELEDSAYDNKDPQSSSILIPFQDPFKSSAQQTNELFHNGLVDSNVALDFGESQFLENSLNEVKVEPPKSSAPPATRLLDHYQKTDSRSNQIAREHDSDYQEPKGIINEHSQQKLTVKEGDFIPYHNIRTGDNWEPRPLVPYVEIDRINHQETLKETPLSISVETVPTDDTSLIQEVLEEVYNISGPVDAGSSQQQELSGQNVIDDQLLPDYSNDFIENSEDAETTTINDVTENEDTPSTTIILADENISEEINTTTQNIDAKNNEDEQTTISFFVTPTTQYTNTVHDELLYDPLPTIHENTLILENVDSDESTTSDLGNTLHDESNKETKPTKEVATLEEEAAPEVVDEKSTIDYNSFSSDQDTTEVITTVSPTTLTDNFEVTTFRPKGNGGFFENFNLANLLSYIVPKRTTTGSYKGTTVETPTPTTTEEESKPVIEITTTTIEDETSKSTIHQKESYTTVEKAEEDPLPTHLPSTISWKKFDAITTTIQNEVHNKVITSSNTESLPTEITKTPGTSLPVQTVTRVQPTVYIAPSTAETTYKQEEIDTTTKSDIVFETTTEPKLEETTTDTVENEYYPTTTEPNYVITTYSNRIRTDRPFRGPFRIQKTYKKGSSRYQLKNKTKKFGSGLKKKLDDKNKKDSTISKAVYGAIKREEYIKNWVARKYNKLENNSKKRLFSLNTTFQPQTTAEPSEETTPESVTTTTESQASSVETTTSTTRNAALPFAPTILPPKNKLFNVDLDVTIRDSSSSSSVTKASSLNTVASAKKFISEKRKTFLDKLKSTARKNLSDNLFAKSIKNGSKSSETSSSSISKPTQKSSKKISWVYPRGSDTNVFKTWGGNSLSQAEFERKVLGVSTATEVSVKSRICVRGRCYNADDKQSLAEN